MTAVPISAGDEVYVDVVFNARAGKTTYYFENLGSGLATSFTKGTPYAPGSNAGANFIIENHHVGSDSWYVDFNTESFAMTDMQGTWGPSNSFIEGGVNDFAAEEYDLSNGAQDKSWETAPGDNGGFHIYSENAGC